MTTGKTKRFITTARPIPLEAVVQDAQIQTGSLITDILPLYRVEPDPDNPRRLDLDPSNPRALDPADPEVERKREALEGLDELAANIAQFGVQQPIKVYPYGKGYRIVFGERRYFASILAGKQDIPAWILPDRPRFLRAVQFSENELQEKLDAWERLENIRAIVHEYESYREGCITSAADLSGLIGLKLSMANHYFDLLDAPAEVRKALQSRKLNNIELAARIARDPDPAKRQAALESIYHGATKTEVQQGLKEKKQESEISNRRGRPASRVSFGGTQNIKVVRLILERVFGGQDKIEALLGTAVNWDDYSSVTQAWKRLLKYLEEQQRERQ